ncbi:MAG TPA: DUF885 domain-containing protein [Caulobacteraceae bacterium]|nr:DUF885 domain-containing protein [Caulobacteraceae bacterium]
MRRISRRTVMVSAAAAAPLLALVGEAQGAPSFNDYALKAISKKWLDATAKLNPVSATQLGDHRYDDKLDDMSAAGRADRRKVSDALLKALVKYKRASMSRANQVDAAMLENQLRYDLWTNDTLQSWAWDPLIYNDLAGGAVYSLMAREFAPAPVRLKAATARLEALPTLLAQARANLVLARVPKVHADTLAKQNPGLVSLVDEMVLAQAGALPAAEKARLEAAAAKFKAAVAEHQKWIETTLVPGAKGDFRLGAALYDAKLAFALNSPLTRAEIKARALAAHKATREAMYALAAKVLTGKAGAPEAPAAPSPEQQQAVIKAALDIAAADHPKRDEVVQVAKTALEKATAFVREKDLITLPEAPVQVILMPEFQRGVAVAYCDPPGPLDKGQKTFYAVSPIPTDWTETRVESFLREYNNRAIADISVHEAMPGHYVQLAHSAAYPGTLRSVLWSGSFVEGWAVYAEEMMAEEGFYGGDPLYRLVRLKTLLRSVTNALLDQAIHVDGMSRDEAMKLMMEGAFQEEGEASGKWIRASVSSAQLPSYFVGYSEHKAIRAQAEKAGGFNLKAYHDKVLSFGSPPGRFVRQLMFNEPIA